MVIAISTFTTIQASKKRKDNRGGLNDPPFLRRSFMRTVIACALVLVVLITGCGMELKPTPEKAYRDEIETMKKVKEHQTLQFEILRINAAIAKMKALADAMMPTYELAPPEKTKRPSHTIPEYKVPDPNE